MEKILVVEDDKLLLSAIEFKLRNEGYDVQTASDGTEALKIIEKDRVDLIVSDIMMPNLSGFELLSMLRRFYYYNIPFIAISSLDKANIYMVTQKLGANIILNKPIDFDLLIYEVRHLIDGKKAA